MKELAYFTKRHTQRAKLAQAALSVCRDDEIEIATRKINQTAFSCPDVLFWADILRRSEQA